MKLYTKRAFGYVKKTLQGHYKIKCMRNAKLTTSTCPLSFYNAIHDFTFD